MDNLFAFEWKVEAVRQRLCCLKVDNSPFASFLILCLLFPSMSP